MKGDKLYCIQCEKYSVDTWKLYESRNGGKPKYTGKGVKKLRCIRNCPHCGCNIIVNVNQIMIDNILMIAKKENNYKGSKLYQKFKKDWPLLQQKALNSLRHSLLLEENKNGN